MSIPYSLQTSTLDLAYGRLELDRLDAWITLDLVGGAHKWRLELDAQVMRIAEGRWSTTPGPGARQRRFFDGERGSGMLRTGGWFDKKRE
jgi:hypothetical protein